jgi:hypothetical protein
VVLEHKDILSFTLVVTALRSKFELLSLPALEFRGIYEVCFFIARRCMCTGEAVALNSLSGT